MVDASRQKGEKSPRLLVATRNRGKVRELRELLKSVPLELVGLGDFDGLEDVEETGSSFRENAELKAVGYARQSGLLALADDSGLEVEVLGGAPGIYSARFAGAHAGYNKRMSELLRQIDDLGGKDRSARFVCVMAVGDPAGKVRATASGICEGEIAREPRGINGFGYDPIFVPTGFDRTFGELPDDIKQQISHRARAAAEIMRYLLDFTGV
jgi:XTP/dITP diphosphohydrolase